MLFTRKAQTMRSLELLREQLSVVEEKITAAKDTEGEGLLKVYRHWLIEAISFIQRKHFDKS